MIFSDSIIIEVIPFLPIKDFLKFITSSKCILKYIEDLFERYVKFGRNIEFKLKYPIKIPEYAKKIVKSVTIKDDNNRISLKECLKGLKLHRIKYSVINPKNIKFVDECKNLSEEYDISIAYYGFTYIPRYIKGYNAIAIYGDVRSKVTLLDKNSFNHYSDKCVTQFKLRSEKEFDDIVNVLTEDIKALYEFNPHVKVLVVSIGVIVIYKIVVEYSRPLG